MVNPPNPSEASMSARPSAPSLFEILPTGLFKPLASRNRAHYWRLINLLYDRFFGPEADLPPPNGYEHREITRAIEGWLETHDPWEAEDGISRDSPLGVRANLYLDTLVRAGWITQERLGMAQIASMPTVVAQYLGDLLAFLERGPVPVGAKMRSIEAALQRTLDGSHAADDLEVAAAQARELVTSVSSLGVRIRELMRGLSAAPTTAAVLRQIFSDYIGRVYMADYADLTGADHPLARKSAVMSLTYEIESAHRREAIIQSYMQRRTGGDREAAEAGVARALKRVQDLDRLQDFLDRLEDDLRRMNRRMLALIDYRLRAPDHFDVRVRRALAGALSKDANVPGLPVGPGQLLSGELLYKPRQRRAAIERRADRRRQLTPEQEAIRRLQRRAIETRMVRPSDVTRYLEDALGLARSKAAADLPITSINDLCVLQALTTASLQTRVPNVSKRAKTPTDFPGFSLIPAEGRTEGEFLAFPAFRITRKAS